MPATPCFVPHPSLPFCSAGRSSLRAAPRCVSASPRPPSPAPAPAASPAPRRRGNGGRGSRAKHPGRPAARAPAETPAARRARLLAAANAARGARVAGVREGAGGTREKGQGQGTRKKRRLRELVVGEKVVGRVRNLVRHGAYVDIGAAKDGLVHVRDMSVQFVFEPGDVVREGQEVAVWVKYVDAVKNVVGLTMVPPAGPVGFSGRRKVGEVRVGEIIEGVVARVTNYGAYVDVGAERHAFVHVSRLWGRRQRETLETLRLGRSIRVQVLQVDEVKSFIMLNARGRRDGDMLKEESEVETDINSEDHMSMGLDMLGHMHGLQLVEEQAMKEEESVEVAVRLEDVLQRHGQEIASDEDQEQADNDQDEMEDDEDDEDEGYDELDQYEMDFDDEPRSRLQAPRESFAQYENDIDGDLSVEDLFDFDASANDNIEEEWSDPTEHSALGRF